MEDISKISSLDSSPNRQEEIIETILSISDDLNSFIEEEKDKLPYNLNIIDELYINENAHSRILCKLLQYRTKNGSPIYLNNLIEYIIEKTDSDSWSNLKGNIQKSDNISITSEKERIDLWIRTKEFSIIVENKIYGAEDQKNQIARYIRTSINNYGINKRNIYVIYLTRYLGEPDEQSWEDPEDHNSYKNDFLNRYINLSYNEDIIRWLENIYKTINPKGEPLLDSAVYQYIDYLKGLSCKRYIQKDLVMDIEEFISERLGIKNINDNEKIIHKLEEERRKVQDLANHLSAIEETYVNKRLEALVSLFQENCNLKNEAGNENLFHIYPYRCYIAISGIPLNGETPIIHISRERENGRPYCQIEFKNKEKVGNFYKDFKRYNNLLSQSSDWCVWHYFTQNDTADTMFEFFKKVIENYKEFVEKRKNS